MVGFLAAALVAIPLVLAFFSPMLLICLYLGTGALPLAIGGEGMGEADFGRYDLYSIRVLGLWLASMVLLLPLFPRTVVYAFRFRWHAAFLLFVVAAMIWSPSLLYGARMVAKLTAPFLFCVLVLVSVRSWSALRAMERAMLFSGIFVVAVLSGGFMAGYIKVTPQVGLGVPGLGPAGTSAHLAILAMLALAAVRTGRAPAVYAVIGLAFTGAVIAGFTRITIVGLLLGMAAVLWVSTPGWLRWIMPFAGVSSVPALFLFSETFRRRMFKSETGISLELMIQNPSGILENIHGSGRFEHWAYAMKTFFDPSPLFGSGVGTTQHYFYTHQVGMSVIHSEYVRLLAEVGLFGTGLLVVAVAVYMVRLARTYRLARTKETKFYALAALGGLVVYVIFMATDNAIDYVTSSGIYVFGLIAMSEKARDLEAASEASPVPDRDALPVPSAVPSRRYPILAWK